VTVGTANVLYPRNNLLVPTYNITHRAQYTVESQFAMTRQFLELEPRHFRQQFPEVIPLRRD